MGKMSHPLVLLFSIHCIRSPQWGGSSPLDFVEKAVKIIDASCIFIAILEMRVR